MGFQVAGTCPPDFAGRSPRPKFLGWREPSPPEPVERIAMRSQQSRRARPALSRVISEKFLSTQPGRVDERLAT